MDSVRTYYYLTKPGIIRGNLITALAGFCLASVKSFDWITLLAMAIGLAGVMASGCVFNNVLDQRIDRLMSRTRKRALVTGRITNRRALVYGTALGLVGFAVLLGLTTQLSAITAAVGWLAYVVIYGWGKRNTVHGTLLGSISGAIPPVVGYTAVSGRIDAAAIAIFLVLVMWQMPHFYAIAMYRQDDYKAAGLPVMPLVKGRELTQRVMIIYVLGFVLAALTLTVLGYTGWTYAGVMLIVGAWWLVKGLQGSATHFDNKWPKQMFGLSLVVLMSWSVMIMLDRFLP